MNKQNRARFISVVLALAMAASSSVAAFAAEDNEVTGDLKGTGYSALTLEVVDSGGGGGEGPGGGEEGGGGGDTDPAVLIATVPVELPVVMDLNGNITVPEDAVIINHVEDAGIEVTAIDVAVESDWAIAEFSDDFTAKADNTKEFGLKLRGDDLGLDGTIGLSSGNWQIAADGELPLNMRVRLPKHTEESKTQMATIGFTLDWSGTTDGSDPDAGSDVEINPPGVAGTFTVDWDNGLMLPKSKNVALFKWSDQGDGVTLQSVESSDDDVASVKLADAQPMVSGQTAVVVTGNARGTATVTGTLSNGQKAEFEVAISELDADNEPSADVDSSSGFNAGDVISPDDITVTVPVVNPDGSTTDVTVTPDTVPDTPLVSGDNEFTVDVDVNGVTITVKIVITVKAENPSDGLNQSVADAQAAGFTFASYQDGLEITNFTNTQFKSEVNVPEQIGDFKVVRIGDAAFDGESNLTKVTLPETVKEIGVDAFKGCTSLSLDVPAKDVAIGLGLGEVKELHIKSLTPNKDISGVAEAIGSGVDVYVNNTLFTDTEHLKKQTVTINYKDVSMWFLCIGDNGQSVDARVLDFNKAPREYAPFLPTILWTATDVVYPKYVNGVMVEKLPPLVFPSNMSLKTLYLPDSIKEALSVPTIGSSMSTAKNKGNIVITVNNIEGAITTGLGYNGSNYVSGAFVQYTNTAKLIGGEIQFPSGITEIPDSAFNGVLLVENVEIPSTVTRIGTSAFSGCSNLTSVVLNDGLETIGEAAFNGIGAPSLEVPDSVATIGENAFRNVQRVMYNGSATGSPWGAVAIN